MLRSREMLLILCVEWDLWKFNLIDRSYGGTCPHRTSRATHLCLQLSQVYFFKNHLIHTCQSFVIQIIEFKDTNSKEYVFFTLKIHNLIALLQVFCLYVYVCVPLHVEVNRRCTIISSLKRANDLTNLGLLLLCTFIPGTLYWAWPFTQMTEFWTEGSMFMTLFVLPDYHAIFVHKTERNTHYGCKGAWKPWEFVWKWWHWDQLCEGRSNLLGVI